MSVCKIAFFVDLFLCIPLLRDDIHMHAHTHHTHYFPDFGLACVNNIQLKFELNVC